jgi:hypothetical protein
VFRYYVFRLKGSRVESLDMHTVVPQILKSNVWFSASFINQYNIKLTNTKPINHTGAAAAASLVCSSKAFL